MERATLEGDSVITVMMDVEDFPRLGMPHGLDGVFVWWLAVVRDSGAVK